MCLQFEDINNNYLVGGNNEHEDAANPELIEVRQTREKIKQRVMNQLTPIGPIYDEIEITCLTCCEVSSKENIRSDRSFYLDMQKQSISCSICTWIGSLAFYRKHIDQNHNYRESIGTTTNVYTKQSDQGNRSKSVNNIEACQEIMSDIFSSSCSIFLPQNSSMINDQHCIRLSQIQEIIRSLSNHLNILTNDQQSTHNVIRDSHTLLQIHARNFSSLKVSSETNIGLANALKINYDLLAQELWSIKRIVDDPIPTSYCGRYIWKITNVQERIGIY
ncbi:unnamed protein product [Rotaria sordida]|uniref:Uncharacterized protein n=1 Tax=Rotaria sordida TaxID=392033 RepID=A0A814YGF8_9BILA|nr:unnamed protein product [Rotaria sordida]